MDQPLPLPLRTALAFAGGENAASVYEGGFNFEGEREEPCLNRCFPDFETLNAGERFETFAEELYRPMLEWMRDAVEVVPRAQIQTASGEQAVHV
jgi:exodeoxyribonuclease V gamma subunit